MILDCQFLNLKDRVIECLKEENSRMEIAFSLFISLLQQTHFPLADVQGVIRPSQVAHVKNLLANAGVIGDASLILGSGRFPGRGKWQPLSSILA